MLACLGRFSVRCRYLVQIMDCASLVQAARLADSLTSRGGVRGDDLRQKYNKATAIVGDQQPRVPALAATPVTPLASLLLRGDKGIAGCRCLWQMQAARNFRSRAISGPSQSRPGNGNCGKAVNLPLSPFFGV